MPHPAYTWEGCAGDEGGAGQRATGRSPQRGEEGSHGATPPPVCPTTPMTREPRGRRPPTPPEAEGTVPPPPGRTLAPRRGDGAGPASTPEPLAPAGTVVGKRTGANTQGHHTDRARGQQVSTNRSGMGATPSMARATPRTPALLPA